MIMNKRLIYIFLILIILLLIYCYNVGCDLVVNSPLDEFVNQRDRTLNQDTFTYVYLEDFMDPIDFKLLKEELKKFDNQLDNSWENLSNVKRFNLVLESPIVKQIINKYQNKIRNYTRNSSIYLANNFPIEYRKYVKGSFMAKHRDVQIYKLPQYECVFTISNTTDSYTQIGDKLIVSKPNSIIILKAKGVEHEVSKVTQGERKFLKFIFTETDEFA